MYLIINQQDVNRVEDSQVLIALTARGELALDNSQAGNAVCVLMDGMTGVELSRLGRATILLNSQPIPVNQNHRINGNDEIRIGNHSLQARVPEPESRIARALRQRAYEIQSEIHHEILDRMRISNYQIADDKHRQQIEVEIDRQLSGAEAGPEIEEFLGFQALREMLMDRVNGYDQIARRESASARASKYEKRIAQLAAIIGLDREESPKVKSERIDVLLPWVMQTRKDLMTQADKRALALAWLRDQLIDLIFGLGPLEDLLKAPDISEIMVLPSLDIHIERNGRLQHSGRRMPSVEMSRRIIERIVAREGRRIDQSSPMVDVKLADGSRGNFVIEPVSVKGPAMTIRRFSARRLTVDDLLRKKTVSLPVANFLRAAVVAKKNVIIAGGTGSGKTTLLNILSAWIANDERIVTVEDTAEISLPQEHVVTMQARPANLEGKGAITIRDLVRNALRMRPDRIIVGECRGGETLDMLQAMSTGHDGSLTTVHANAPWDATRRLEVLALEADGIALPVRAVRQQIASALDLIVQVERFRDGQRRITSVCEVVEFDEDEGAVVLEEIYQLRRNRKKIKLAEMDLEFTGYVPNFIEDLLATKAVTLESLF